MNKRTRISLTIMIAVIILLTMTIPAMAKKGDEPTYSPHALTVDKLGNYDLIVQVYGELDAYWENGTLINDCEGFIPFGEPINAGIRYATFEEACDFFDKVEVGECMSEPDMYVLTFGEGDHRVNMTDVDSNRHYWATYSKLEVTEDGNFSFKKVYIP